MLIGDCSHIFISTNYPLLVVYEMVIKKNENKYFLCISEASSWGYKGSRELLNSHTVVYVLVKRCDKSCVFIQTQF